MHLQLSPTPTDLVGIWIPPDLVSGVVLLCRILGLSTSRPSVYLYQPTYPSTPSYIPMSRSLSLYRPVYGQEHVRYQHSWLYKDTTGVRFYEVLEQVDLEVRSEAQDG